MGKNINESLYLNKIRKSGKQTLKYYANNGFGVINKFLIK